ncbi:hypothetical protein PS664_01991 [Pseudomonas fluorescens]|nr:hypothetical protein PS664_01991 [Pseudomonas fluorescens]
MGHSANYQMELYVKDLERLARKLEGQGAVLRQNGCSALALSVFDQAQQLRIAIEALKQMMK